jgi:hypothetical protein
MKLKKKISSQQVSSKIWTATLKQTRSGSGISLGASASASASTINLPLPALPLLLPLPHHCSRCMSASIPSITHCIFLGASKRLYKILHPSVGLSVSWFVGLSPYCFAPGELTPGLSFSCSHPSIRSLRWLPWLSRRWMGSYYVEGH